LLAVPLSGWLAASSEAASINFFGVVSIPYWTVSGGHATEEFLEELHEVLGNALVILASLHALVALKHHFLNRDDVLKRMLPGSKSSRRPPVST